MNEPIEAILERLLAKAKSLGADQADAHAAERQSLSASVRLGALEDVEREESRAAGLRVIIGKQQAGAQTSDIRPDALDALAERVVAMARAAAEDPWCGLPDPALLSTRRDELSLYDSSAPTAEDLETRARLCEEAALAVPGVTNSAGAGADWGATRYSYAASNGFRGAQNGSSFGVGIAVLAEANDQKERDYDSDGARWQSDLKAADAVGRRAGERTIEKLGGRKIDSQTAPVIFENRVAARLLGAFSGAISGGAIARGVSFLRDALGTPVFAPGISIVDDPFRVKGWGSHTFDGEGVIGERRAMIDDGVLTSWFLNTASARQLGLKTTGHASASLGGSPGIGSTNLTLMPSARSLDDLMADAGSGLVVREMFSPSINQNTGDFSVGISGYWFSKGQRDFPVTEVTVAGNLKDMFRRLIPGSDIEYRSSVCSPSVLIDAITIAGR